MKVSSRQFHQILKETDSEQESEDSSDSDGDNKEVCKVNKSVRVASYLYALSRVQESAERKHSLRQRQKEAETSGRVWTEDVGDAEEHRKLHQALYNRYKDLIDLDVQKEWVDPKAHIIWEVDHPDHIRWMDQHSLEKADDQCAKVWIQRLNDLTVQKFVDNLTRLQDEWSQEGLISYLKSLTVEVDSHRLQCHFHRMKYGGNAEWPLRILEGPASTLVMRLPKNRAERRNFLKFNICFHESFKYCGCIDGAYECLSALWRCFAQCFGMRYVTFGCGFSISPAKKLLMCSDREMAVLLRELTDLGSDSDVFTTVFACNLVLAAEMRVRPMFKFVIFKDALFIVLLANVGYDVRNENVPGTLVVLLIFFLTLMDFFRAFLRVCFYCNAWCKYKLSIAKATFSTLALLVVETMSIIFVGCYILGIVWNEWHLHGDQFHSWQRFLERRIEMWCTPHKTHEDSYFATHPNFLALLVLCRWTMFISSLQLIDMIGRNVVPLAHSVTRPASVVFMLFLTMSLFATFHAYFVFPLYRKTDLDSVLEGFIDMFRLEMLSDFDLAELQNMHKNISGKVSGSQFEGGIEDSGNQRFHQGIRIGFVIISLSLSVVAMNTYIGLLGELYSEAVKKNQIYNHYLAAVMWPHLYMRPVLLYFCGGRADAESPESDEQWGVDDPDEMDSAQELCWMFYDRRYAFDGVS